MSAPGFSHPTKLERRVGEVALLGRNPDPASAAKARSENARRRRGETRREGPLDLYHRAGSDGSSPDAPTSTHGSAQPPLMQSWLVGQRLLQLPQLKRSCWRLVHAVVPA